jgi:hypothetical protein
VNVTNIKKACEEHYGSSIGEFMEIDVLAGEQGPSCQSMKHIKDLRLIYVRFIKRETLPLDNSEASTSVTNYKDSDFADSVLPRKKNKRDFISDSCIDDRGQHLRGKNDLAHSKEGNVSVYPKSLSTAGMLKLGKVVKESPATVIEVSTFCTSSMSWSKVKQRAEFVIDKKSLGQGGFRVVSKRLAQHIWMLSMVNRG